MNNTIGRILAASALSIATLSAQGHGPQGYGMMGGARPGGDAVQNSADAIARRVTFLTSLLTLTTAQASQATTIFTNAAAATAPLQTNLSDARTSLKAAVQANNAAQIDQLAAQIGIFTSQMIAADSKAEAAFYALLTAEQRTRYEAIGGGRGGRH